MLKIWFKKMSNYSHRKHQNLPRPHITACLYQSSTCIWWSMRKSLLFHVTISLTQTKWRRIRNVPQGRHIGSWWRRGQQGEDELQPPSRWRLGPKNEWAVVSSFACWWMKVRSYEMRRHHFIWLKLFAVSWRQPWQIWRQSERVWRTPLRTK